MRWSWYAGNNLLDTGTRRVLKRRFIANQALGISP